MGELSDYRHRLQDGDNAYLGHLAWYTVSETTVAHTQLAADLQRVGLGDYLPSPPCDADVFRRVLQNGQRKRLATDDPDVFENLLVRQVAQKDGKIIRRVVVERVDQAGERLDYSEAIEVTFDRTVPEKLRIKLIKADVHMGALTLAHGLAGEYHQTRGCVNGQAVRDLLRGVLEGSLAISVRSGGGVYFVPEGNADRVAALADLAARLPGADFHSLPLIDDRRQREMLKKAFEAESIGAIDRAMADMIGLEQAGEEISMRRFATIQREYEELKKRTGAYSQLLSESLSATTFRLRAYEAHVTQLLRQVKPAASTLRTA